MDNRPGNSSGSCRVLMAKVIAPLMLTKISTVEKDYKFPTAVESPRFSPS